jgi:hypothetical protein
MLVSVLLQKICKISIAVSQEHIGLWFHNLPSTSLVQRARAERRELELGNNDFIETQADS